MRPAAALALVLAAGCGGAGVEEVEEGLSVCAKGTVTPGVDVSHYDGTIDWAMAKASGIAFAFMKATESTSFVDPTFATNWKDAGAQGIIRGPYHFFRASVDGVQQADYFLQNAGSPGAGDFPLALDLETLDSQPAATVAQRALDFLQHIQDKTGRTPVVYTSASFLSSIGSPAGFAPYTLWVANWQVTCPKVPSPPWNDWVIWQHSSTGTVPGITGMVDLDEFNGTPDELKMLVGNATSGTDGGVAPPPDDAGMAAPDDADTGGVGFGGGGEPAPQMPMHGGCSFSPH
jgi:lysozyme